MKQLTQTNDYLLLVDEESEIKVGNYRVHIYEKTLNHPVHRLEHGENTFDTWKLVLAYYPLSKEAKELDLPLLPNPFESSNVEEDAYKEFSKTWSFGDRGDQVPREFFLAGYKAAQSKQFSLEDMKYALNQLADEAEYGISNFAREAVITKIIQSLSTQQLPKEFIPEYEKRPVCRACNKQGYRHCAHPEECGGWIEMDFFKTITNSEGKQELVGVYKY